VSSSRTETDPAAPGREAEEAGGTLVSVEMPKMGISVSEGTILEWRKQPGDWVEADETIADVTTDKVDVEIPSPSSGRLARIVAEAGDTVEVGATIAEIDADARAGEAHPEERSDGAAEPASAGGQDTSPHAAPAPEPAPAAEPATSSPQPPSRDLPSPEESPDGEADRSRFYSPVVRRIADKHDVDLSQVRGTGIGGRVRKRDVVAHVENGQARPAPVLHTESPYRPDEPEPAAPAPAAPAEAAPVAEAVPGDGERREAMSSMRRAIARHMVSSRQTAAHCTTVVEVDMSRVATRRRQLKDQMARRGVGLTYLAFVARATVETLEEFPILNASVDGEEIVYHDDVNLGIAVALESGLIVPVIPRAQRLSLEGMAAEIGELAERARAGKLAPDDVHGGTFTITNPGQFGAVLATPIINQPQVAILDLEAIVKRPVVVEGPEGDSIAIRPMAYLPLSFDHRALDGADAARFMARVKARLEGWEVE
jgi:2-oxoglutarate dehydrogenase dihydrolipoamide succinyltransferase (E2 component)